MKIHYQLTVDQLVEASVQSFIQGPEWKPYVKKLILLSFFLYLAISYVLWSMSGDLFLSLFLLIAGNLISMFLTLNKRFQAWRLDRHYRKTYKLPGNDRFFGPTTLEFLETKVRSKTAASTGEFQWEAFQKLSDTSDLYILNIGTAVLVFPKKAFKSKSEEKSTIQLIKKKLASAVSSHKSKA